MQLRPMELGEIVDRSAAFWRAHWKRLYGLFFAFSLTQYAALKGAEALGGQRASYGELLSMLRALPKGQSAVHPQASWAMAVPVAVVGLLLFSTLFVTTAASHYVLPSFLGEPARVSDGVRHALRKLGTLVGLFLLALGWALLALVAFELPGAALCFAGGALGNLGVVFTGLAVMAVGFIGWALWFFLRFALWGPIVASENVGALGAFRRCGALTSGRVGPGLSGLVKLRLMILITVVASMLLLVSLISGAPTLVLHAVYGDLLDPSAGGVPAHLLVPAELLNLAVGAVVYPLYVAFQVIFYADVRARREGLDLELKMRAAA